MADFASMLKLVLFGLQQVVWTCVTVIGLIKDRLVYGANCFTIKEHPKPKCLEGWNEKFIQLKTVRLHYVQTGDDDKPLLLMLHGFPEFWYSWRFQLKHFADRYRCIAVDQRGYNLSDKPSKIEDYNIDLLANDVRELVEGLGYKKCFLMGHDWGALVAWQVALLYPELVEKLLILNAPHPCAIAELLASNSQQMLKSWYIFMFQTPKIPELALQSRDLHMFDSALRDEKNGIRNKENFTDEDMEAFKHVFAHKDSFTGPINYYRNIRHRADLKGEQNICKPQTLIIWGDRDPYLLKDAATLSLKYCKNADLRFVDGASHWVQQDEPHKVNRIAEDFLNLKRCREEKKHEKSQKKKNKGREEERRTTLFDVPVLLFVLRADLMLDCGHMNCYADKNDHLDFSAAVCQHSMVISGTTDGYLRLQQIIWTFVAAVGLVKDRLIYGADTFTIKDHPRPKCLEGWNDRFIQLKTVRLHYVQTGDDDKPLLLMLHGFPEFWYSWRFQLKYFADRYRCIALDQRGYNLSDRPPNTEDYCIDLLVNDVREVVEKLGYKKCFLMGHDWGAAIAWRVALTYPELIEKLLILNVPHPSVLPQLMATSSEQRLKSWYIFMFQTPRIPELTVQSHDFHMLELCFRGKKAGIRNKENFTDEDMKAWKHVFSQEGAISGPINYYRNVGRTSNLKGDQNICKPPTLIIWGDQDQFLVKEGATMSLKYCYNANLKYVEGASHWVMQDEPQKVNKLIEEFLYASSHAVTSESHHSSKILHLGMSTRSDIPIICFPTVEKSFTRAFLGFIELYDDRLALIDPVTQEMLAFSDLEKLVFQMRHRLHKRNFTTRTMVATLCGNSIDFLLMCLAAIDLGAIVVPINPASTLFEIEKYVVSCEIEHMVIEREYEKKLEDLRARETCEHLSVIILEELRGEEGDEPTPKKEESQLCGHETALVFFSSGTTGPPKAIRHSHRSLLAHLAQVMSTTIAKSKYPFPNLLGGNRVHGVLPYFHAGGLITVFCMLIEGVTVVINRKWNQLQFLLTLQEYKITVINIVPPILDFLVSHPSVKVYDLSALRLVFVGATKCEESQLRALKERLPGVEDVVQLFGTTEAGMLLFATPKGNTRLSSVGRPMPGVEALAKIKNVSVQMKLGNW
ncbi:hypothetical protein RB195_005449 [Necator americanus]|uniref:Hydrolase, alpha/beta domain protein n=1 Tax=Necator americanus TaxID=51031 RepID=A0ABR1BRR7_NECAM